MQLSTDEPWDMMKVQILVKSFAALNPPLVDFDNYESNFTIMNGRACNMKAQDPTINLLVVEKKLVGEDKENNEEDGDLQKPKSKGKVSICIFYEVQFCP